MKFPRDYFGLEKKQKEMYDAGFNFGIVSAALCLLEAKKWDYARHLVIKCQPDENAFREDLLSRAMNDDEAVNFYVFINQCFPKK